MLKLSRESDILLTWVKNNRHLRVWDYYDLITDVMYL